MPKPYPASPEFPAFGGPHFCRHILSLYQFKNACARHCKKAAPTPEAYLKAPVDDVIDGTQLVAGILHRSLEAKRKG